MFIQKTILFTWVLIQQLLVASGTYLLARFASSKSEDFIPGPRLYLEFSILVASMLLSGSFLHLKILLKANQVFFQSLKNLMNRYIETNNNHPRYWRDKEAQARFKDPVSRSFWEVTNEKVVFEYDSFALVLNIALNTIAVGLATGWVLGSSLIGTLILGMVFIHLIDSKIERVSEQEQKQQNNLQKVLNSSWDSVVLGNTAFLFAYKEKLNSQHDCTYQSSHQSIKVKQGLVATISFFTNLVVLVAAFIQWKLEVSEGMGVRVLILLPRAFQIVYHCQILQSYWIQWKALRSKLVVLRNATSREETEYPDPVKYIDSEKMRITLNGFEVEFHKFLEKIRNLSSSNFGRVQIQGANGAGKSSLLLKLKEILGENAIYLPANHQLVMEGDDTSKSSGEKDIQFIETCISLSPAVLILDEWDAHLSLENQKLLKGKLEIFAQNHLLIEVIHVRG